MLLIETLAYAMSLVAEEAQMTADQHLVSKASRGGLLALGANRSTPELPPAAAVAAMRFSVPEPRAANTLISEGTRVSAGSGGVIFLTLQPAVIAAGQLSADVTARAETTGVSGNGFLPGQINTMLDPVAGVSTANTATSEGGADSEDVELYRLRVANAFDRVSTGGSHGWYRETAMAVSSAIIDVAIVRPQPCYVDIYPLTADGAAGPALRDQVLAAFNTADALDIRFGDEVTIKAAAAVVVAPVLTVRLRGATAGADVIAATAANGVLTGWRERLGAPVAPSEIEDAARTALKAARYDVVDAEISAMPFQLLTQSEYLSPALIDADDVIVERTDG